MRAILQESLRMYGSNATYRRAHLVYLFIVSFLVLILWPNAPYIEFFKLSSYPPLYEVASIATLILVACGSMYVGKMSFARQAFVPNTDWIEKTTVPVPAITAGRSVAGVLHTVFLVALAFPLLVVAAGPSGVGPAGVARGMLVVFTTALASRFGGMWIDAWLERRPILSVLATWAILAAIFIVSIELLPDLNPIVALASIGGEPDLSFATFRMDLEPLYLRSVLLLSVSSVAFVVATAITLTARRRRFHRTHRGEVR